MRSEGGLDYVYCQCQYFIYSQKEYTSMRYFLPHHCMTRRFVRAAIAATIVLSSIAPAFADSMGTKTVDTACMKTAVQTREQAVQAAFETFHTSVAAAYDKRETDLVAAWGMTDAAARKKAIKDAWSAFKKSSQGARKSFKETRNNAWKTFKNSAKTCHGSTADETGAESVENAM